MVKNLNIWSHSLKSLSSQELTARLHEILHEGFGFTSFRPYQEDVCRAAASGKDLLLVMPTGAGKSLCYQIPGMARQETTLVISPLLALIEDQVAKLKEKGFHAERIHSGRDRDASREVCVDYLKGNLDFLFIAPERLAVPGFVEMLAKRKPGLIAVDEAHCISQWGHDFRPEYRMLGQRLPALRPAPIIALTATATPRVQEDICERLGIPNAKRFIHGFRRTNIAVEVAELNPGERIDAVKALIAPDSRRPAIIYAPTRKKAEEATQELSSQFSVATYHAGLSAKDREAVQSAFIKSKIDVIVATIAFGMGIDKADVRTVAHLALPASVEAYYQEIGRAGRDGKPSRAVLMYSFVDRKTHEFFHDRDYPDVDVLDRIYLASKTQPMDPDDLRRKAHLEPDEFERALEKLWIHGGVSIDQDQRVAQADESWRRAYSSHCDHRKAQLEQMTKYAGNTGCRMLELVRYFGDQEDGGDACNLCDYCAPDDVLVSRTRPLDQDEAKIARATLVHLNKGESPATGALFRELSEADLAADRRLFERVLNALARSKLIAFYEDSFEKSGQLIKFRRVHITAEGRALVRSGLTALNELVQIAQEPQTKKSGNKTGGRLKKPKPAAGRGGQAPTQLVEALKAWRLAEARSKRIPAFRILSDRVLMGIAEALPRSEADLLNVHGFGPKLAEKFGRNILSIIESNLNTRST